MNNCQNCGAAFEISDADLDFYRRVSPVFAGEAFSVPAPTVCPECRLERRLCQRNEFCYYPRQCARCGRSVVAVYAPDCSIIVYCHHCWWGDEWEPLSFGVDYDPGRPFFAQFAELKCRVPQPAMMNDNGVASENCEYTQDFGFGQNCYLCTAMWYCRDCLYCTQCNHVRDLVDSLSVSLQSELVYESCFSQKLYSCSYLSYCSNCSDCHFGVDLKGCKHCLCCFGLRQKEYCIYNKQYSKVEYEERFRKCAKNSASGVQLLRTEFKRFSAQFPRRALRQTNCDGCLGDNLFNCKDFLGTDIVNGEYCRFAYHGDHPVHCYDVVHTGNPQWCYEGMTCDNSYQTHFTTWCWKDKFVLYSDNCHSAEQLFGCIGLRRRSYCVLNKQYGKRDYETLVARIIRDMIRSGEWGEFFPIDTSPFAYNESKAYDDQPLARETIAARGLRWKDLAPKEYSPQQLLLPDTIEATPDSLLEQLLACAQCKRNYRITPSELLFYRRLAVPVPRDCPQCRRRRRILEHPTSTTHVVVPCAACARPTYTVAALADARVLCDPCYMNAVY